MNSLWGGILNAANKEIFLTTLSLLLHHTSLDKVCSFFLQDVFVAADDWEYDGKEFAKSGPDVQIRPFFC